MISPMITIDPAYTLGVSLNITMWFDFADEGDYGEVYVRNSTSGLWIKLKDTVDFKDRISGTSGGFYVVKSYYIDPTMYDTQIQIRLRMVSNGDDCVSEGWYVCDVTLVEVTAIGPPPSPGDTWYAFDAYSSGATNDHSIWFDSDVPGALYPIGTNPLSNFWSGGTWADGEWYVSCYGASGLYTVDIGSGATTLVGPTSTYFNGLAYDEGSDKMYGVNSYTLYEIDRYTGATTTLGSISAYCIDIAFGGGILWGHDFSADTMVTIDPVTLTVTTLGSTGIAANYAQGMEYDKGNDLLYLAAYTSSGGLYIVDQVTGHATLIGAFQNGAEVDAFAIPYAGGDVPLDWGVTVWHDDFDRLSIAPWTCVTLSGGDYWDTTQQCITGYPLDIPVNNAMYRMIDLTDPQLYFAEFYFTTAWDIEDSTSIFIEISADWDGVEDMQDATWVAYWQQDGASAQDWISSTDLVEDDRFVINEFLGEQIYLRFRLETTGEGKGVSDGFWCIDDKTLIFKLGEVTNGDDDDEAPVTNAFFDCDTAKVTLVAVDYPLNKPYTCGVKATYYKIDGGSETTYTAPFTIPEGTHTISFYSIDNCDNKEVAKTKTYTVDTTPPTVTITSPKAGFLYLFGSEIMERILSDKTLCIGKVPIAATADDGTGSGVNKVLFAFNGGTSWDESAPYEAVFKGMKFGDLTITVTAIDNVGLESSPATMTVAVYSLGLF